MDFNFDEFLAWVGEDMDTLMMLIWIIPVIVFVFYGQRIQLLISSNEIKKDIGKLEEYTTSTKKDFLNYVKNNLTSKFGAILGKLSKKEQKFKLRGR